MVAIDQDREEARPVPRIGESLLPIAAVYGPNASGKSNVLAALSWVRDAVEQSLRYWEDEIPVEPFAFVAGPSSPSEFIVELAIEGIRFEYVLELDSRHVIYEALFHYPEKKRKRLKRAAAKRPELRTIVAFCEGVNSEPDYIRALQA